MTGEEDRVGWQRDSDEIDETAPGAYLRQHLAGSEAAEKTARALRDRELDPEVGSFLERF